MQQEPNRIIQKTLIFEAKIHDSPVVAPDMSTELKVLVQDTKDTKRSEKSPRICTKCCIIE